MGLIHIISSTSNEESNEKKSEKTVRNIVLFIIWIMLTICAFFIGFTFLGVFFIVLGLCIVFWLKDNKNESNIS